MTVLPKLSFTVRCGACFGTETWTYGKISRTLIAAGKLAPEDAQNIERIAELFIANQKVLTCPECNKTNVLTVRRL